MCANVRALSFVSLLCDVCALGGRTSADYKLVKFVPNSIAIDLGLRGPAKWRPIRLSRLITQENIQWKLDNAPPALIS